MATNNSKFKHFGIVLNAPKEKASDLSKAKGFLTEMTTQLLHYNKVKFLASIIHDKDFTQTGEPKTIHEHIVIETYEKSTEIAFLKAICEYLNIDKALVSIEGSNNEFLITQYLTHQNHKEKAQYSSDLIMTTNEEELKQRLETIYESQEDKLKRAFYEAETLSQFVEILGVESANKYRQLFKELKIERAQGYEQLLARYEQLLNFTDAIFLQLKMSCDMNELEKGNFSKLEKRFLEDFYKR